MDNSVGRLPNQVSATGLTHLERGQLISKIQKKYKQLTLLAGSSPDSSGKVPARLERCQLVWKRVKEKINETVKKGLLLQHENIVSQPLNQLVCNRANSSGKGPAHLENIKTKD